MDTQLKNIQTLGKLLEETQALYKLIDQSKIDPLEALSRVKKTINDITAIQGEMEVEELVSIEGIK